MERREVEIAGSHSWESHPNNLLNTVFPADLLQMWGYFLKAALMRYHADDSHAEDLAIAIQGYTLQPCLW